MATYSNFTVWFYDDALTALGSTTNILSARYKCGIDNMGEGEFTLPLDDTQARQWVVKYNVAVFTCEIDGNIVCFGEIVIERGDEIVQAQGPGVYRVKGLGRLSKLSLDRMNYQVISDGAQGATVTAVSDILTLSQYATWNTSGTHFGSTSYSDPEAYLATANETLLDALVEAINQENHHIVDVPGGITTEQVPENRIYLRHQMDQLDPAVPGGFSGWHFKEDADPANNAELPILTFTPITEEREVATKIIAHGGGLGSGTFTMSAASGTRTAPSGYSYDFVNSTITNTALEAISNQPRKTEVANLSNIKPEDPTNTTSVQTAAEQLVDAAQRWIEERIGGYDEYYRIDSLGRHDTLGFIEILPWPGDLHAARIEYAYQSPYDTSGAENATTIINLDKMVHFLEVEYRVTAGTGESNNKLLANYLLGPAPRQERGYTEFVADEIKELRQRLDHADAQAGSSTAPSGTTYVTTDAPLLTAVASSALANERAGANGDGTIFTDDGAGTTFHFDIRTPLSVGSGSTNSGGNSSTGHSHASNLSATDLPNHVLATNAGLGSQHTVSGLTARQVLIATGATTALFRALVAADLPTGSTLSVSSANSGTSHAITTSNAVTSATAVILATDGNGRTRVQGLGIGAAAGANAITVGDDVWIGLGSSAGRIVFDDQSTDQIEMLSANVLVGASSFDGNMLSTPKLYVEDGVTAVSVSGAGAFYDMYAYGSTASDFPAIRARRARGSRGTPTAVQDGDILGRFGGAGYDGSSFPSTSGAFSQAVATGAWTASDQPAEFQIHTTPAGSTTSVKRLTVAGNGDISRVGVGPLTTNISVGSNATTNYDTDFPDVSTANANFRLFRSTNTSGTRQFVIYRGNASSTADHTLYGNGGYVCGSPTGGDKGVGTINAQAVYDDNTLLTDFVFESDYPLLTIDAMTAFYKGNKHLPTIPGRDEWEANGKFSLGKLANHLWETIEVQAIYISQLNERISALEN